MTTDDTDWVELSRRAGKASHRLVGWIYWEPEAIAAYAALGVPDGLGYYIASRGAPLGAAGNDVVTAAFYSIHPAFVAVSLDLCREHTTFAEVARVRDEAVVAGLRRYVPEVCDGLAALDEVDLAARSYLWHAARAEMFRRLQRTDEARAALDLAIDAAPTEAERRLLDRRAAALG